jgi:hypothetical protein
MKLSAMGGDGMVCTVVTTDDSDREENNRTLLSGNGIGPPGWMSGCQERIFLDGLQRLIWVKRESCALRIKKIFLDLQMTKDIERKTERKRFSKTILKHLSFVPKLFWVG